MYIRITTILLALISGSAVISCTKSGKDSRSFSSVIDSDSIPEQVKELVMAINDHDSLKFAKLVSYPLQRPYPLHDIKSEEEMKHYYTNLVDDSLRNAIIKSRAEDWSRYGWRGWSLGGEHYVWVDENVYAMDYLSAKERGMLDSLLRAERATLAEGLGEGWSGVECLRTQSGDIYRIDRQLPKNDTSVKNDAHERPIIGAAPLYRLSIYHSGADLSAMPQQIMEGEYKPEGTAQTPTYIFRDQQGRLTTIEPETPDGESLIILPGDSLIDASKTYWLEQFEKL